MRKLEAIYHTLGFGSIFSVIIAVAGMYLRILNALRYTPKIADTMTEKPYFNNIVVGGLFIKMDLKLQKTKDIDGLLKSLKEHTKDVLVWVTCPECNRDVPGIDMTKYGYCYFCLQKKELGAKKDE